MSDAKKPSDYPFQVHVVGGSIHSGHDNVDTANSRAVQANKLAEELGLKARYEVKAA